MCPMAADLGFVPPQLRQSAWEDQRALIPLGPEGLGSVDLGGQHFSDTRCDRPLEHMLPVKGKMKR